MKKEKFDELWNIINDTAIAIQNDTSGRAIFNESQKDLIYHHYETLNKRCKQRHMAGFNELNHHENFENSNAKTENRTRLDRHKVASCMACAIMRVRPMEITETSEGTNLSFYANEVLAFFVSLSIMKSFTNSFLERQNENDLDGVDVSSLSKIDKDLLRNIVENGYVFPQRNEEGDYLLWQLIALEDIGDFTEYVISLSCTLFLIEEYTIQFNHNLLNQTTPSA